MNNKIDFEAISSDIKNIMYDYVSIGSFTDTVHEKEVEPFFLELMQSFPYFQKHPEDFGLYPIPNDHLGRSVCWALVRGRSSQTICMVHHYDVVGVEDFKTYKDFALKPDELHKALEGSPEVLSEEAREDLLSNRFIFCKGGCDMKAGGSVQYALLREYGNLALAGEPLDGNVLVIGVPDEENLSAGMRGAVTLLAKLKEKEGFEYKLMINSEPHQRRDPDTGVFSLGSIGKLMPFVYVRGSLSHVGKVFEGLNPVGILSEIQRRTEISMDLADVVDTSSSTSEAAPPPTWIYSKDSKDVYDVSMPLNAYGCLSILNLTSTPGDVLEKMRKICEDSFAAVIQRAEASHSRFLASAKRPAAKLPWTVKVSSFNELLQEARHDCGTSFDDLYDNKVEELVSDFNHAKRSIISCNYELLNFVYDYVSDGSPRVVYGLVPPYYPCVSNLEYEKKDKKIEGLFDTLLNYSRSNFDQEYIKEYFFSGISDLSYIDMPEPSAVRQSLQDNMPLFGPLYDIPLEDIHQISMPGINVGPWGKDFHKLSERVLAEDLMYRTPRLVDATIYYMLHGAC